MFVAINRLKVPAGGGTTLEERFAARKGAVDQAEGFVSFELLRPVAGSEDYFVVTHWDSQADFDRWTESQSFRDGHRSASDQAQSADTAPGDARRPVATDSAILAFEVVLASQR